MPATLTPPARSLRGPGYAAAFVAALGLGLYLPRLGTEILRNPLEVKYALVAREMLHGGPLLVPHLFGELYPDKPPLYFWTTAAFGRLAGGDIGEVTARLPAALAAVAALLLLYRLGTDLFGSRVALLSACTLATSNLFFWYAREGHPDQFLNAFVILACLGLWHSLNIDPAGQHAGWTALAYAAMALGVLSKVLLGLVLPLLAAAGYLGVTGPMREIPRRLHLRPGLGVFLALVLAWYGPAVAQNGWGYFYETLIHQHLVRYTHTWMHHEPWYYLVGQFVAGFFPWVLLLPSAVTLGGRAHRIPIEPAGRAGDATSRRSAPAIPRPHPVLFPLAWLATGFVFLSLSSAKRGAYLLPLYPAAALMVGWLWDAVLVHRGNPRWIGIPLAVLGATAAALAVALVTVPRRFVTAHLTRSGADTLVPAGSWPLAGTVALLLAGVAAIAWAWRRDKTAVAFGALVAVQAVVLLTAATVRAPQYEARLPVRAFVARVRAAVPPDQPVLSLLRQHSLLVAFYLDRRVTLGSATELAAARASATGPRYALVDDDEAILRESGTQTLEDARFGSHRVVLIRVDPAPAGGDPPREPPTGARQQGDLGAARWPLPPRVN